MLERQVRRGVLECFIQGLYIWFFVSDITDYANYIRER